MLSFDITDRHVRIVKGTEQRGRVRVSSATTIDLQEGLIINGHIKDIPKFATIVNDELKARKMDDKEAVVTLSSNLVLFKELAIPKAKTSTALLTMVTNQMQHTMGTSTDYSVAYSIAGETEQEGNAALKILATACPFDVVDAFRKAFQMLSISLRSVTVTCNSISRIILSDRKNMAKMPMLAVQIDPTFVSINLYENGQLSFARFASIDAADYDNSEDYVFEAVNENIVRMLQFHRSKNPQNPIQNVTFYGDTSEYIRLTNSLEGQDITTSLLGVPNNISGYENIEFQSYANAIGAMFRSDKDKDRINLLETDATAGKTDAGSGFFIQVGGALLLSAAVVGAVWLGFNNAIRADDAKVAEIDEWMNSPETLELSAKVDATEEKINKVANFQGNLDQAIKDYTTKPKLRYADLETLTNAVADAKGRIETYSFGDGYVEMDITAPFEEDGVNTPDEIVAAIYALNKYKNITYTGYTVEEEAKEETTDGAAAAVQTEEPSKLFRFNVTMYYPANELPEEEAPAEEETPAEEVTQ
ncbi:MAG: pilus assembly protein PilM [Oscillospiraceae bacterium]|nr:pilus assembly protein PilM [Oscillospiraceae bacterium]